MAAGQNRTFVLSGEVAVTTAGTRQELTTTVPTRTPMIFVQASPGNAGTLYVGDVGVTSTKYLIALTAGQGFGFEASKIRGSNGEYDLSLFYVDTSHSGDKYSVSYEAAQ